MKNKDENREIERMNADERFLEAIEEEEEECEVTESPDAGETAAAASAKEPGSH